MNLIIGEPNVGKSNLLEAMTLLGGITYEQTEKFMGSFIRYEEPPVAARSGPDCRYAIHQHPAHAHHFLIVLEPACDTWIFEAAHAAGLDPTDFKLPAILPAFIEVMKGEDAEDNPHLIRLLHAIKQAQPAAYRELAVFVADVMDQNSKLWR